MQQLRDLNDDFDKATPPRFALLPFDALRPRGGRQYLIKGLMPRRGLTVVWGPPKCGKSFWAFDAAMHVALGWEYRGRRVTQGPVVYCAFEGADGFNLRAEAFRMVKLAESVEPVPFRLLPVRIDLIREHEALIPAIRTQMQDQPPVAVVLDTLNRSLVGSERDDEAMGAYIAAADAIRQAFDCAVVVVHHCGIDGTRPRGHTSLTAAADAQIAVQRTASGTITATVEDMKDGPEGDVIASRLASVTVGVDDDGDDLTSCVVEEDDYQAEPVGRQVRGQAKVALDLLKKALADEGEIAPASNHIPMNQPVVTLSLWRSYFYEGAGIDGQDARQKAFKRSLTSLQEKGMVGVWGNYAWTS